MDASPWFALTFRKNSPFTLTNPIPSRVESTLHLSVIRPRRHSLSHSNSLINKRGDRAGELEATAGELPVASAEAPCPSKQLSTKLSAQIPPLAHIPLLLRQQRQAIRQQTLIQRAHNRKLTQQKTSHWCTWNVRSGRNSGLQQAVLDLKALHVGFAMLIGTGFAKNKADSPVSYTHLTLPTNREV